MNGKSYSVILLLFWIIPLCSYTPINSESNKTITINQTDEENILAFSNNKLLSTDDDHYANHVEVSMAISENGTFFVGWKNSETHNGGGARVSFVRSLDHGKSWSQPYDMPKFEGRNTRQSDPWLYWYNGTIYFAYLEGEPEYFIDPNAGYLSQITVAKSTDYGVSWIPVKASNGNYFADKETIVVGENNTVYVVYDDASLDLHGNVTVRLSRSIDGGDSYQEISALGEDEFYLGPYITLNGSGDPFVAWSWVPESGGNLFLSKSLDKGLTFDSPKIINNDGNYSFFELVGGYASKVTLPVIKFDSNNRLYILWDDKFDQATHTFDVYLRYSDNYGESWSDRLRVNSKTAGNQWNPDMVIDKDGKLHIVYYSEINDHYRPYYRTIEFTGINKDIPHLTDEIVIADSDTPSFFVRPGEYFAIQLDTNGIPHVVWTDGRNNELDIYYAKGLTNIPLLSPELITFIIVISIITLLSISIFLYYKYKKNSPESRKLATQKIKDNMKIYA